MKKINRNFFKPFMFICLCLMTVTLISAAVCDPPGQPDPPRIVGIGNTWCTIEYTAPKDNGGCAITGYCIEFRYKDDASWNVVASDVDLCRVRINGLIEGEEVEFRVSAINVAGKGKPSKPSQMVLLQ